MHLTNTQFKRSQERGEENRSFLEDGLDTIDEPAPGIHRGVLAGMTPEEREAVVSAYCKQNPSLPKIEIQDELNDSYIYCYEPERTLLGTFCMMNKQELITLAKHEHLRGYSKLTKIELAVELWNHYEITRYSLPHSFAGGSMPVYFELGEKVYRAGGMLEISRAEHDALPLLERWMPWVPFLNVFDCDDKLYAVIPNEFMEKTREELWEDAIREKRELEHARHLTSTYLELCGVVKQATLTELYQRYYPDEYDAAEFENFLWLNGPSNYERYNLWTFRGETYVINIGLVDADLIGEPGKQVHIDGDTLRKVGPIEDFRRHLAMRHAKIEPWEVPGKTAAELEAFNSHAVVRDMPSAIALRDFLDAHVPDGANDYFYAENILEDIELAAVADTQPTEILHFLLEECGAALDSGAKADHFLGLLTAYVNDIPRWTNNGWAPSSLAKHSLAREAAKPGKRVFYDESGRPRKVGRNEPCPCGSGKKYKRCCGR